MTKTKHVVCGKCGNPRKKVYSHESGQQLCQSCLVILARGGRKDFRCRISEPSKTPPLPPSVPYEVDLLKRLENTKFALLYLIKILTEKPKISQDALNLALDRIKKAQSNKG